VHMQQQWSCSFGIDSRAWEGAKRWFAPYSPKPPHTIIKFFAVSPHIFMLFPVMLHLSYGPVKAKLAHMLPVFTNE
jgi:hypothetical protein